MRNRALGTAAVSGLTLALLVPAPASAASQATGSRLVVADAAAGKVYVYSVPGHRRIATISGRTFADHAGLLPLKDGRVVFVDEAARQLVALQTQGAPRVVGTAPLPEGEVTHLAADPAGRHVVVAAAEEHDHEEGEHGEEEPKHGHGTLTAVDLATYRASTGVIHTGHPGVVVGAGTVVHRNDDENTFESYRLSDVLAANGAHITPTGSVPIGAAGHGEAYAGGTVIGATDDGLDTAKLSGGTLAKSRTIAWPSTGRGYYLRLTGDGRLVTTFGSADKAADWTTWRHKAFVADPATGRTRAPALGTGFLFRHSVSDRTAGYVLQRPDADQVSFVNVRPGTAGFGAVTSRVTLPRLPGGPVAGTSPWEGQFRRIAQDPSGALAYVTGGGTGKISVISPDLGRVVSTITTPSTLDGGGALTVVTPGRDDADKVGR
ncbi:hypothetical protein [Actinomadura hibisca]|uniref:hypothetical protein n=1 Tax=Actinomadura hibisca TaxID=68565 RepID=UPI0008355F54|nr:hypothetical protein [Actinomadura hibisca]